jgi:predicted metal-dependent peptidase
MDANLKIARCKTSLMVKHPFFGSIALGCHFVQDDSIETMATDGTKIIWAEPFVDRHSEDEIKGVIAHEVMHIVMKHHLRRGDRDPKKWNVATDYAINDILTDGGFVLPEDGLFSEQYKGMAAEKIFDLLPQDDGGADQPSWGIVMDATNEDGSQPSQGDLEQMAADIDQRVFMAAQAAENAGKLPSKIKDIVSRMRRSQVDWMDVIRRFVGGDNPEDYTWRRCNRKVYYSQGIYMPSVDRVGVGDIVLGWDSSGSVSMREQEYFLGVFNQLIEDFNPRSITLIVCDAEVQSVTEYAQGEYINGVEAKGRGGTRVMPVFDYVEDNQIPCDAMVYLTDMGIFDWPNETPDYPVLWVSTDMDCNDAPIGETTRIQVAA